MPANTKEGFVVTSQKLTTFLSICAVIGICWKLVTYVNAAEFRDHLQDLYIQEDRSRTEELVKEMKQLNTTVNQLVTLIKGSDVLLEAQPDAQKHQ